ncbi:MAG: TolB family protein, partial [Ktedonobacteraceae bacterium]
IAHNLYVINGDGSSQVLVNTGNVYDPAVSPDGKSIAFIEKYKQYSDLCMVATTGGQVQVLRTGNGKFYYIGPFIHDTYNWYAQPAWSPDGSSLLFLSDLEKEDWYAQTGIDAPILDLQAFSIPISHPTAKPTDIAYASFGDGGNHDVSYRPGHSDQIIYTHYAYDAATETQQVIQLFMENPNTISQHPHTYYPGAPGGGFDPGIAITDGKSEDLQPAFSPNGNAIAYAQRDTNQMSLNIMPTPPDTITQTPNDPATEKLAVQVYQTQTSKLLSLLYVEQPVWSPDGKQLAYIAYNSGSFDLWITNLNYNVKTGAYTVQGSPIQVTTGGVDGEVRPVWVS